MASSYSLLTFLVLKAPPPLEVVGGFGLVAAGSYAIDRARDAVGTGHDRWLWGYAGVSLVLGAALMLGHGPAAPALLALLFPGSVVAYSVPWLRRGGRRHRIKDIPYCKAFYSSCCWAMVVPWSALYIPQSIPVRNLCALSVLVLLQVLGNVIACDFKDIEADRAAGVVTFPVAFGRDSCLLGLHLTNAFTVVFAGAMVWANLLPAFVLAGTLVCAVAVGVWLEHSVRNEDSSWWGLVGIDVLNWLVYPVALLASGVWGE
jgi:4-hydroxybenzoate polyprenyltransferase